MEDYTRLHKAMSSADLPVHLDRIPATELSELREMYEPYANSLGAYFLMALPHWLPAEAALENWRTTTWDS